MWKFVEFHAALCNKMYSFNTDHKEITLVGSDADHRYPWRVVRTNHSTQGSGILFTSATLVGAKRELARRFPDYVDEINSW